VGDAQIPVIGNVSAEPLATAEDVREDLRQQIRRPVRWYQSLDLLERSGIRTIVEIGPGRILTSQAKRSNPNLEAVSLDEEAAIGAPTNV
jgi:[acyl-carrier-protein] S-malonyltransferase